MTEGRQALERGSGSCYSCRMTQYAFATTWDLEAPIDRVWSALADYERWHEWFPALRRVAVVEAGRADGTGAAADVTVRGALLPYDLTFRMHATRVEPPRLLELAAVGDLEGSGRWTLAEEEGVTTVRFEWRGAATKAWMNAIAPAARPLFGWNHDAVMRTAGRGLARSLGVPLRANESGPVEPDRAAAAVAVLTLAALAGAAIALGRRRSPRG